MKIENNLPTNQTPIQRTDISHPVSGTGQSQATEKNGRQDRAELSERARLLAQARSTIDNIPDEKDRDTRVQQLREQVESGNYTIPVRDLARKLLDRLTAKTSSQE